MKQLHLEKEDLVNLGFKPSGTRYALGTINGYFYYNPEEAIYTWYHRTVLDEVLNDVHLNITSKTALLILLKIFRATPERHNFYCKQCDKVKDMTQVAVKHAPADFECIDCYAGSMSIH